MEYIIIGIVALVIAVMTFFSGFGLGTLLMPVFAIFFSVEIAIAVTAIVHLANNIFKVALLGKHANIKIVVLFAIPGAVTAIFGALLLNHFVSFAPLISYSLSGKAFFVTPVKVVIATLIIIFAVIELIPSFKRLSFDLKFIPFGGMLSGFFGGLSGHQGALRSAFLLRTGLDKKPLIGTMVISAAVVDVSRLTTYGLTFFQKDFLVLSEQGGIGIVVVGTLSAFIGSFVGARLLDKITLNPIKLFISIMLFLLAVALGLGIV